MTFTLPLDGSKEGFEFKVCSVATGHALNLIWSPSTCSQGGAKKKLAETDAIFEHLNRVHTESANSEETLRLSIDTKAKVKMGPFSRRGRARGKSSVRAADHDMAPTTVLTPAGILEVEQNQFNVVFGTSRDTSDFVADAMELWWQVRLSRAAFRPIAARLKRASSLSKWSVIIQPQPL